VSGAGTDHLARRPASTIWAELETWLLLSWEAIVIRLRRRRWISRATAALRLNAIDLRLAALGHVLLNSAQLNRHHGLTESTEAMNRR
jgi:hypothetical protein